MSWLAALRRRLSATDRLPCVLCTNKLRAGGFWSGQLTQEIADANFIKILLILRAGRHGLKMSGPGRRRQQEETAHGKYAIGKVFNGVRARRGPFLCRSTAGFRAAGEGRVPSQA